MLDATLTESKIFTPVFDRKPRLPWCRGWVALLGDATHPMTPNFGQGGCQAIEDAIILANAFDYQSDPVKALQAYQRHRFPRAKRFVNDSWRFGKWAQGEGRFIRLLRNRIMLLVPKSHILKQMDAHLDVQSHLDAFQP